MEPRARGFIHTEEARPTGRPRGEPAGSAAGTGTGRGHPGLGTPPARGSSGCSPSKGYCPVGGSGVGVSAALGYARTGVLVLLGMLGPRCALKKVDGVFGFCPGLIPKAGRRGEPRGSGRLRLLQRQSRLK